MNRKKYYLFSAISACLFIASIAPFIYTHTTKYKRYIYINTELYDSALSKITSINKAIEYIDSMTVLESEKTADTLFVVKKTTRFVKERFHHDIANYSAQDNWIANLCGKILWSHFTAIVIPDDIILHSKGLCNQQAIVYMEILKRKGISCRKVGLGKGNPGHFLTEVYYNGSWHLYDVNKEPEWTKISHHHKSMEYYRQNPDTLYKAYENQLDRGTFNKLLQYVEYGKPNEFPAKHMMWFHKITKWLTYIFPVFFFFLTAFYFSKLLKGKFLSKEQDKPIVASTAVTNS